MNYIEATFNKLTLFVGDPLLWAFAKRLTGKIDDVGPGQFEMSLSAQNLQRIRAFFETRPPQPIVRSGRVHIERLRANLNTYKHYRSAVAEVHAAIESKTALPLVPNGKYFPYVHHTWIVETLLRNPFGPVFADCGLGKSGALGRAIELLIDRGEVRRGKILISAPLSILKVSWLDDLNKFTNLRSCVLWTSKSNKTLLHGEEVTLLDYGPRPPDYLTARTKKGVVFVNSTTGEIKHEVTTFDDKKMWQKFQGKWREAVMPTGEPVRFGPMTGKVSSKEKTRENYVRNLLVDRNSEFDVYITNHDSVRMYAGLFKEFGFDWVVVDESTKIKSPNSQLSWAHVDISWKSRRRTVMTGTPNPNGFEDLWQQFYFLDRGLTLEPCFRDYIFAYFKPESKGWRTDPEKGRVEIFDNVIRDEESKTALVARAKSTGIYLKQRDCIDLPPRTDLRRIVYMTKAQADAYRSMEDRLVAELRNKDRSVHAEAVNILSQLMKLRQLTSGFLTNTLTEEVVRLDHNPKLEELDAVLDELGDSKFVIAAQFREEISMLEERYKTRGVVSIHGGVSPQNRERAVRMLQTDPDTQGIILQPQAAAHGITLTAANYLVFPSLDYNFDNYYQVAKRIERLGQKNSMFVIHLLARYEDDTPTIDEDLLEVLHYKNDDREALFGAAPSFTDVADFLVRRLIQRHKR